MKRVFALIVAFMLCCGALGEGALLVPAATPAPVIERMGPGVSALPNEFEFRGLRWGSTPEQVRQTIGQADKEVSDAHWHELRYADVAVSNYQADWMYCAFLEDQLRMAMYVFESLIQDDGEYMTAALSEKYGPPADMDDSRLYALISAVEPLYREEFYPFLLGTWALDDGTFIASFYYAELYYIIYADEPAVLAQAYNTAGL